jgi:hypothetical protein
MRDGGRGLTCSTEELTIEERAMYTEPGGH